MFNALAVCYVATVWLMGHANGQRKIGVCFWKWGKVKDIRIRTQFQTVFFFETGAFSKQKVIRMSDLSSGLISAIGYLFSGIGAEGPFQSNIYSRGSEWWHFIPLIRSLHFFYLLVWLEWEWKCNLGNWWGLAGCWIGWCWALVTAYWSDEPEEISLLLSLLLESHFFPTHSCLLHQQVIQRHSHRRQKRLD